MKNILLLVIASFAINLNAQIVDCAELFISEYIEGPGNNNAIEIYNPTTASISLIGYTINRYGNGITSGPDVWQLSGTIASGEAIAVGNGQLDSIWVSTYWSLPVDSVFYNACDIHGSGLYPTPFYFNGDDAITLEKNGNIIDIFGKVGEDPGLAWTDDVTAGYTDANGGTWWTKRQTLVRKSSVKKGVTMNPILFNPTLEYDSLPDGTYSEMGSHVCDCLISSASWDCVNGTAGWTCIDPGTGNGAYASLSACQSACVVVTPTWDCDGQGNCSDPGTGQGTYASLSACQSNCIVVTPTWDCDGQGNCSDPGTGQGTYASLSACQSNCIVVTPTWDCDGQGNCSDPGTGQGTYASLSACQSNCVATAINEEISNFLIYPNPANIGETITINANVKIENIDVVNILGEKVLTQISNKITTVNLIKGTYIINIRFTDGRIVENKLIID